MTGAGKINGPITVGDALNEAARRLTTAHVERPRPDARLLVAEALGVGIEKVMGYPELLMTEPQAARLEGMVCQRERREPIAQIFGRREFWSLDFAVTSDTLTPRPDTETVVQAALDQFTDKSAALRILDLGTGTGCLLLALLSELPNAHGVGVDISETALGVAKANAQALGLADRVDFTLSDWGDGVDDTFDMVVSNPPYIPDAEIDELEPEVAKFDPRLALAGGADGLDCYRTILWRLPTWLRSRGVALFEVGQGQEQAVSEMAGERGFALVEVRADLSGIPRCVVVGASDGQIEPPNSAEDKKNRPD